MSGSFTHGRFARVVAGLTVLIGASTIASPTPSAGAERTFNQNTPITIGDGPASPYPSELTASGLPIGVAAVQITLRGFTHDNPDDVDIMLVAPNNGYTTVFLSDAGGGNPVNGVDLTFWEHAADPVADDASPATGTYKSSAYDPGDPFPAPAPDPATAISAPLTRMFPTGDPNGVWKLFVVDDTSNGESGSIAGWSLRIITVDPPGVPTISAPAPDSGDADGTVVLSGSSGLNSPITAIQVFDGTTQIGTGTQIFNGQWTFTVTGLTEGAHTFTVRAADYWGNLSAFSAPVTVNVDRAAPGGTLVIDDGATRARKQTVVLTLTATDQQPSSGMATMRFSTDGTTFSPFEPFAYTKRWRLPAGDGMKTVHVQFADRAGNLSAVVSDSIILDTTAPRVVRTWPATSATVVDPAVVIRARASEPLRGDSVSRSTVTLVRAGGTAPVKVKVRYRPARQLIVLDPKQVLQAGTTYRVTIESQVTDLAGNRLDQKKRPNLQPMTWRFTTG